MPLIKDRRCLAETQLAENAGEVGTRGGETDVWGKGEGWVLNPG